MDMLAISSLLSSLIEISPLTYISVCLFFYAAIFEESHEEILFQIFNMHIFNDRVKSSQSNQ